MAKPKPVARPAAQPAGPNRLSNVQGKLEEAEQLYRQVLQGLVQQFGTLEAPIHPYWPIGPIDSLYEKGESGGDADRRDMCVIDGFVS